VSHGHRPPYQVPLAHRTITWLVWWAVLLAFWIILDWSVAPDELLAGAGRRRSARSSPNWLDIRRASGCGCVPPG
jgi:hypothetical protein